MDETKSNVGWTGDRWKGIVRPYTEKEVDKLRGSLRIEHTLAKRGAERLWRLLQTEDRIAALGALTGHQAVQQVQAGLKAVYVSGWQVAADANTAGETYPDQSLYPVESVPNLVRRINNAFKREDEKQHLQGKDTVDWFAPIVADAEAGFGGPLNAFELMKSMIEGGAAGVHFEDQLSSVKKCGHMGGKVLVPTHEFIEKLIAARLAADVMGIPTVLIARTDSRSATLITSDSDPADQGFLTGERTPEGFFRTKPGLEVAIARAESFAPYGDLLWFETSEPDLSEARRFAEALHAKVPGKALAYNLSPSFNWSLKVDPPILKTFQQQLSTMGYKFQFVTLAGFHALNHSMFEVAREYVRSGVAAYARFQDRELASEKDGYVAVRHQEFASAGYFDEVAKVISGGRASTLAMEGATEAEQFKGPPTERRKGDRRRGGRT